jgi:NAD-dependent deacetylase
MSTPAELLDLIKTKRYCSAFTGAGVSTLSGIPDFRGPGGLYSKPGNEELFDVTAFWRDPGRYYSSSADFIYGLGAKEPCVVHRVLARMEKMGLLRSVITQNIDMLHQRAGSERVFELHGSPAIHACRSCGHTMGFDEAAAIIISGGVPTCPACRLPLKPAIVFFGEKLPKAAWSGAEIETRRADLMLVLGTSLSVYPAARLPELCLETGGSIVLANAMPTHLDDKASMRFDDLGSLFGELEALLD